MISKTGSSVSGMLEIGDLMIYRTFLVPVLLLAISATAQPLSTDTSVLVQQERDLTRALARGRHVRWYENEGAGLGHRLWSEIQAAIDLISAHPAIGEAVRRMRVRGGIRRLPLRHSLSSSFIASFQTISKWSRWRIPAGNQIIGARG